MTCAVTEVKICAILLVHDKLLYSFPFHLSCLQNLFCHLLMFRDEKRFLHSYVCMSCIRGNEEQNLWIGKKTKLKLACEYSPSCLHVGPFLLGSPLKQIISSFVMKHYKLWIQILHLILHFLFFIYVSRELLAVLHNGLLEQHTF